MGTQISTRSLFALLICSIAFLSVIFNPTLAPVPVFGDDIVYTPLTRGITSTEPTNATGTLQVEPPVQSVSAGGYASYNINVYQGGNSSIFLATKNIPPGSVAIFSRASGSTSPEFNSTLTVVTSANTLPLNYTLTVVALLNGEEHDAEITLVVNPATTESTTITLPNGTSLVLSIQTDRDHYETNSTISLYGHVTDNLYNAVAYATVNIQIDGEKGGEIAALTNITTDSAGGFEVNFKLPGSAQAGAYTAFASASKQGYLSATTRTTFVVELSNTPSVLIESAYTGDSAGNPVAVFSQGQTVYVWVVIENIGVTFNGVIWVQILDPSGVPVQMLNRTSSLTSGQTLRYSFSFSLLGMTAQGLYSVNALVSDNLISQGGVFLASSNAQFEVTSS